MPDRDRNSRPSSSDQRTTDDRMKDGSLDRNIDSDLNAQSDVSDRSGSGGFGTSSGTRSGSDAVRDIPASDDLQDQSSIGMRGRDTQRSSDEGLK